MAKTTQNPESATVENAGSIDAKAEDIKAPNALTISKIKLDDTQALLKSLGLSKEDSEGFEQIQTGGITKWIDLRAFQSDPMAPREKPVKGNNKAFAGALLGRHEIEVDDSEQGEINADGTKVRYFYTFRLMSECAVAYKNEDKEEVREIAKPGEIIAIGERHHLKTLREHTEDGGLYIFVIRPHSRVKIGAGRTMWTFDIAKKTVRPPLKVKAELVQAKAPF